MRPAISWVCLSGAVSAGLACPARAAADPARGGGSSTGTELRLVAPALPRPHEPPPRRAGVVDRVIAVVDGDPVLLSELRARARPLVAHLPGDTPAWQRAASVRRIYRELVPQLVSDRAVAHAAERAGIVVDAASVDAWLDTWAKQQTLTRAAFLERAREAGMDEVAVRDEIRRAIAEQRLFWSDMTARGVSVADVAARATTIEREHEQWLARLVARASVQIHFSP